MLIGTMSRLERNDRCPNGAESPATESSEKEPNMAAKKKAKKKKK
jgi:hypothetical protein